LAGEVLRDRLAGPFPALKVECLGGEAWRHGFLDGEAPTVEYRLRVVARAPTAELAGEIGREVEALLTNGPAGGGGARKYVNESVGIVSTLVERARVNPQVTILRSES
jgi:hypothetical protein